MSRPVKMLTRAILLLLAMMTGLSAAQAAAVVRPAQGSAEQRVSTSLPSVARAVFAVKRQALSQSAQVFPRPAFQLETGCAETAHVDAPAFACTHRGDRAQE
jgi:hypothetical protein